MHVHIYIYNIHTHTHIYIHMHSDIVGLLQLRMWIEGLGFRVHATAAMQPRFCPDPYCASRAG